jgi:hypothetical protein
MKYGGILLIVIDKPELSRIFLEIKRAMCLSLLDIAAKNVKVNELTVATVYSNLLLIARTSDSLDVFLNVYYLL